MTILNFLLRRPEPEPPTAERIEEIAAALLVGDLVTTDDGCYDVGDVLDELEADPVGKERLHAAAVRVAEKILEIGVSDT